MRSRCKGLEHPFTITHTVSATFHCSLERAFGVALLGDATRILPGYGPVPAVSHFTEDATWGRVGGTRIPHTSGNLFSGSGPVGLDEVLERVDNERWSWQMSGFRHASFFFLERATGEYRVHTRGPNEVLVEWAYAMVPARPIFFPIAWLFTRTLWARVMERGVLFMKAQAESDEPFLYS